MSEGGGSTWVVVVQVVKRSQVLDPEDRPQVLTEGWDVGSEGKGEPRMTFMFSASVSG